MKEPTCFSFTVPVYAWEVICEGEKQYDFHRPVWGAKLVSWTMTTEKDAAFSTKGALERGGGYWGEACFSMCEHAG